MSEKEGAKRKIRSVLAIVMIAVVLISALAGCTKKDSAQNNTKSAESAKSAESTKAPESTKVPATPKLPDNSKVFSIAGMNISLTKDFVELEQEGYTAFLASNEVAVLALKEAFADYEGLEDYTLEEYTKAVMEVNKDYSPSDIIETDGVKNFTYSFHNSETGETYRYFTVAYKTSDAFWLVQFAAFEDDYPKFEKQFVEWAKMITFDE